MGNLANIFEVIHRFDIKRSDKTNVYAQLASFSEHLIRFLDDAAWTFLMSTNTVGSAANTAISS